MEVRKDWLAPKGYVKTTWDELKVGDEVYILGWNWGVQQTRAYGPHTVVSCTGKAGLCGEGGHRVLRNGKGKMFLQYQDCLLKKV
jgi:hypothetical protein